MEGQEPFRNLIMYVKSPSFDNNKHQVFNLFRERYAIGQDIPKTDDNVPRRPYRNIMCVKNDLLYIYEECTGSVIITRSTSFCRKSTSECCQLVTTGEKLAGALFKLIVREYGDQLVIATTRGVYLLNLPPIWHKFMDPQTESSPPLECVSMTMIEPTKKSVGYSCFVYEPLQVRYHPVNHSQLYVLYNDNYLRVYDSYSHQPLHTVSLGRHPTSVVSTVIPLGEHTVDFDFAPARKVYSMVDKKKQTKEIVDEIFLVKGDGDIFTVKIKESSLEVSNGIIVLNCEEHTNTYYNMSSILVMNTTPITVVLVTYRGFVYHCVLNEREGGRTFQVLEKLSVLTDLVDTNKMSSPVQLMRDETAPERYVIEHEFGVSFVKIPAVTIFNKMLTVPEGNMAEVARLGKELLECTGELKYLIYTPSGNQVDGLVVFGNIIIILCINRHALTFETKNLFKQVSRTKTNPDFRDTVSNYLQSQPKVPTLNCGDNFPQALNQPHNMQAIFNPILRVCEKNVRSHAALKTVIDQKLTQMVAMKHMQQKELNYLKQEKQKLIDGAESIAEKYEENIEKITDNQKRIEALYKRVQLPSKTLAEEKMKPEVEALKKRVELCESMLKSLQLKVGDSSAQGGRQVASVQTRPAPDKLNISARNRIIIRDNLSTMTKEIGDTKERVRRLKSSMEW